MVDDAEEEEEVEVFRDAGAVSVQPRRLSCRMARAISSVLLAETLFAARALEVSPPLLMSEALFSLPARAARGDRSPGVLAKKDNAAPMDSGEEHVAMTSFRRRDRDSAQMDAIAA